VEEKKKQKTKGGKSGEQGEDAALQEQDWSQEEQKALELALLQFPKVKQTFALKHLDLVGSLRLIIINKSASSLIGLSREIFGKKVLRN